jgi:hypothetical protein
MSNERKPVLVVGVYLADRENRVLDLCESFRSSRHWDVEQRWIALGAHPPAALADVTVAVALPTPKFTLINEQLRSVLLDRYAYVVVCDDDVTVPPRFLDEYLASVEQHDFALAQPARTHDSYTDHHFVMQLRGIRARQTRFVEIGPVFSMRADAARLLTPFDEASPMGWGYDFVWPVQMAHARLKMGIVDACPVAHNLRKPVTNYSWDRAKAEMDALLARRPHLDPADSFMIVKSFA